ncbi:MAG: (d)CMP kinase, partial [Bacteroidales bacterium]|nr:(d)CMP kinase [Bacteroidales bacterium]
CVEKEIRTMRVSSMVSPIATLGFVRNFVNDRLHQLAVGSRVVMDGRDIGTTVFPQADVKIFMEAEPKVRAERRMKELVAKGEKVCLDEILNNLSERDRIDSSRAISPLRKAEDALVLDNTYMTFEQQMDWLQAVLQERFGR